MKKMTVRNYKNSYTIQVKTKNIFLAVNQLVEGQFKNHETAFRMAFAPRMVASSPISFLNRRDSHIGMLTSDHNGMNIK